MVESEGFSTAEEEPARTETDLTERTIHHHHLFAGYHADGEGREESSDGWLFSILMMQNTSSIKRKHQTITFSSLSASSSPWKMAKINGKVSVWFAHTSGSDKEAPDWSVIGRIRYIFLSFRRGEERRSDSSRAGKSVWICTRGFAMIDL